MLDNYYNDFFKKGQQKIELYLYESCIPKDDPVYTLKKILEEMNFDGLLNQYSHLGRKGYNPIMIFAVLLYANMRGIFSVDKIVESLKRDLGFIWLADGEQPGRDTFYSFINEKLTLEIMDNLHYQFIRKLEKENYLTLNTLFLDGTKIEANANRYTFVWRGSINYHLVNLLTQIDELFISYNKFIKISGYDHEYNLISKELMVIEGADKVREVIKKNKERKLNSQKKIPNNRILEIDNVSPVDMLKTANLLKEIAVIENIEFVNGKGKRKSKLQHLYEAFLEKGQRLLKYKENFEIMGVDRNSYSKTDKDATFMRMKDDHMMNGQLKPAYNLQFAVENYFIVHTSISNDRTDYNTLIPIIEKHKNYLMEFTLKEIVADSGYSSEKNLLYLKDNKIESYIKLQEHEIKKTKKYKNNIGKYYNMASKIINGEKVYICHDGRLLKHQKTEIHKRAGFERTFEVFACSDCSGCNHKSKCLYKFDPEKHQNKNKVMKVNEKWDELKAISEANILSEKGIKYRQIRSVVTEGSFGDMKENDSFRRFHRRSSEKVLKEIKLYSMARNINKYHRFEEKTLVKFEGKIA